MLVLKKISVKKLAIYISIIILMLAGTGFMLYQNRKLVANKPGVVANPAQFNNLPLAEISLSTSTEAQNFPPKADNQPDEPLDMNKIKNNGGFDLTIFASKKFQELKENIIISQEQSVAGKRDPFKPN